MARHRAASLNPTPVGALRNVACAVVVLAHANLYARPDIADWWPGGLASVSFFSLVVPLFFVLSGFYAVGHLAGPGNPAATSSLRRRLGRLLPPFLFWNIVTVLVLRREGDDNLPAQLVALFTGAWHLYYVFVLLQFEIVAAIVARYLQPADLDRFLLAAVLLSVAMYTLSDVTLYTGADYAAVEPWLRKCFATWSIFFALGVWLRWRPGAMQRLQSLAGWLLLGALPAFALYQWEMRLEGSAFGTHPSQQLLLGGLPYQVLGAMSVLAGVARIRAGTAAAVASTLLARGSRHTFAVYLMHVPLLIFLYGAWRDAGLPIAYWPIVPLLAGASWLLSQLAARLLASHLSRFGSRVVLGIARSAPAATP